MKRWMILCSLIAATAAGSGGCHVHMHLHVEAAPTTMPADRRAMEDYFEGRLRPGSQER